VNARDHRLDGSRYLMSELSEPASRTIMDGLLGEEARRFARRRPDVPPGGVR
jgi:hypothetical protein